jgi:exopolysaccharide production protein ExoQ
MKKILSLIEKPFAILALVHLSGGPLMVILDGGISQGDSAEGSTKMPLVIFLYLATYAISFFLLILRWKKVIPLIIKGWPICLFTALIIFSNLWSYTPSATFNSTLLFTGTTFFAYYLASRYSLKEQLQLLGWVFFVIITMSFLFIVALPQYGIMAGIHAGAWRGIYMHKNGFGPFMSISAIVFFILAQTAQKNLQRAWIFWTFCGISVLFMALSKSSSAVVNLVIMGTCVLFLPILRLNFELMIPVLAGISSITVVLYTLVLSNSEVVFDLLGKDSTLTGRTELWTFVIDKIRESPWLGYGYGGFWRGYDGPSGYVWLSQDFQAAHPHSGYLQLLLDVGLVGFLGYILIFFIGLQRALFYIKRMKTADGLWPAVFFIFILGSNIAESGLVQENSFLYIFQTSLLLSLNLPIEAEIATFWNHTKKRKLSRARASEFTLSETERNS